MLPNLNKPFTGFPFLRSLRKSFLSSSFPGESLLMLPCWEKIDLVSAADGCSSLGESCRVFFLLRRKNFSLGTNTTEVHFPTVAWTLKSKEKKPFKGSKLQQGSSPQLGKFWITLQCSLWKLIYVLRNASPSFAVLASRFILMYVRFSNSLRTCCYRDMRQYIWKIYTLGHLHSKELQILLYFELFCKFKTVPKLFQAIIHFLSKSMASYPCVPKQCSILGYREIEGNFILNFSKNPMLPFDFISGLRLRKTDLVTVP